MPENLKMRTKHQKKKKSPIKQTNTLDKFFSKQEINKNDEHNKEDIEEEIIWHEDEDNFLRHALKSP